MIPSTASVLEGQPCYWLLFREKKVLLQQQKEGLFSFPFGPFPPLPVTGMRHDAGTVDGHPCVACRAPDPPRDPRWAAVDLWEAFTFAPPQFHEALGRGYQMLHWEEHTRFCPRCGAACLLDSPLSKRCPDCGELLFPHISLAVLALVYREDSVLLVHAHNFTRPHHSCIAGYVEPGETLEQCVQREVLEETNLQVDNVRYFASQPWPFPSLLMTAHSARYVSGDIILQQSELSSGAFFTRDSLPALPPRFTLSRQLIDAWINKTL